MRISDWSSDVCSSDLLLPARAPHGSTRKGFRAHFTRCSTTISLTCSERRPPIGFISMRSLKTCAQTMPQAAYSKWNNLRIAFALKPTRIDGTVQDRTDNSTWAAVGHAERSEEHTSELQSLMRISYAVFCLKKKYITQHTNHTLTHRQQP